jgi:hypothetical protein
MTYSDINLFGVYVAPFVPMLVAAGFISLALLRLADRIGVTRHVWHPALFNTAVYVVVLFVVVIGAGAAGVGGK